jgi:hypothetical protein
MSPTFVKYLHVLTALWLTAGVFGSAVARMALRKAASVPARALAARILWRLHVIYTLPGIVLVGLFAIHIVAVSVEHQWAEPWIATSIMVWIFMFLWTLFIITPALSRLRGAADAASESPDTAPALESAAAQRLWGIFSDLNALAIVFLTYLMVAQPWG